MIKFDFLQKFLSSRKDAFFFAGIFLLPAVALLRSLTQQSHPSVRYFFLAVNFIIFIFILIRPDAAERLIRSSTHILNTRVLQRFILFCLLFEQLVMVHPIIPFVFVAIFSWLYLFSLFLYLKTTTHFAFFIFLHCVGSLIFIYIRLRISILNAPAFSKAGLPNEKRPMTWNTVIEGLNYVLEARLRKASSNSLARLDKSSLESSRSSQPAIVGSTVDSRNLLKNRLPKLNLIFPFFPVSFRRTMTTRAALNEVRKALTQAVKEEPVQAATLVVTVGGRCFWGRCLHL